MTFEESSYVGGPTPEEQHRLNAADMRFGRCGAFVGEELWQIQKDGQVTCPACLQFINMPDPEPFGPLKFERP